MGEVYQATDSKLGRNVAIKLLPEAFTHDADRASRFKREARVLASLNHPNIATIHGVEESEGRKFLVMELVSGETLAERIKRGPIPLDESLEIAKQITEALEAAHEKGVIHRDLKPGNIKVTPEGKVKVLDFGLAKAFSGKSVEASLSNSPTISNMATQHSVILGTAAYMSPEQAKGKDVDQRTDIFAFGALLYEMLTGHQAFSGEDVAEILSHVLRSGPDWKLLPAETPPSIRKLLLRCLEKNLKNRRGGASDVRLDIEEALAELKAEPVTAASLTELARASRTGWFAFGAALVGIFAMAIPAVRHIREVAPVVPLINASINAPEGTAMDFGGTTASGTPELSPDGKWIVFGARTADNKTPLWIRSLSSDSSQKLAGTDGAIFPFWSPDSRYVAFFAGDKLKKIDITGGPPITIADVSDGRGGSWSSHGIILYAPNYGTPLFKVAANGGTPSPLPRVEGTKSFAYKFPWFLPDGRHFLFEDQKVQGNKDVVIRIGSLDSQETVEIGHAGSNAVYSSGHLLFMNDDTLMARPFDPDKRTPQGEAVPIAERVSSVFAGGRKGAFTVSNSGLLAYQSGGGTVKQMLSWFDRTGKSVGTLGEPGSFPALELSPDRKSAAVQTMDATGNIDIWIYDIAHNLRTRFTFDLLPDRDPVWSPDGTALAWDNQRERGRLLRKSAGGKGMEEVLYEDTGVSELTSWSGDGKFLLFNKNSPGKGLAGVWMLPLLPEKAGTPLKPTALVDTASSEAWGMFSPDGHWVAYQSNESQQQEIYVIPFQGPGGKRQISTNGGTFPRWRHDGKEIFYVGPGNQLMAAEVTLTANSIEVGKVNPLRVAVPINRGILYDVSLDGQRILSITEPERSSSRPLTLLQNWTALLKR